jgi:hypothetical protein
MLKILDQTIQISSYGVLTTMEDTIHQINAFWVNKLLTLEENKIQSVSTVKILKDKQWECHVCVQKLIMNVMLTMSKIKEVNVSL